MEESKLIPEDNNSIESSSEKSNDDDKEENVKAFTEFLEKASDHVDSNEKNKSYSTKIKPLNINKSIFKRFLNDGFDGVLSNPNYKMLALLIILLINLSLFIVIGNVGKAFLRNAGIL